MAENLLFWGDNLGILREHIADESVDLVYLDPPFNSQRDYNVLFQERNGSRAAAQIRAFEDTWRWNLDAEKAYRDVVEAGGRVSEFIQGVRRYLGENDMMAYLAMMAPRLKELQRVLKPTGSLYLHCDPTASHYLKLLLDAVFGPGNFRNEIVWCYKRWPSKQDNFQKMHDVILRYSRSKNVIWNKLYEDFTQQTKKRIKGGMKIEHVVGESGKILIRPTREKSPGVAMCDYWNIPMIAGQAKERLGYPTQKPEALLERIIQASSNEGDTVLDPFCGCGTTIVAAQKLNRRWIGIDITHLATALIRNRLRDTFGAELEVEVKGEPTTVPDARALFEQDPFQFQWWIAGKLGGRAVEQKRGKDEGIDGRLYFHDEPQGETKQIILQVKGGEHVGPAVVRELRGVVDRENAQIGVLVTLQEPTQAMITEALSAGFYEPNTAVDEDYPRIQLLTVGKILAGERINYPVATDVTLKKAPRHKPKGKGGVSKLKGTT